AVSSIKLHFSSSVPHQISLLLAEEVPNGHLLGTLLQALQLKPMLQLAQQLDHFRVVP
ncbi:hypothetical protein LSAT2_003925, partial [Lamellibrachia satsuma]